jgi:hypothetical protein
MARLRLQLFMPNLFVSLRGQSRPAPVIALARRGPRSGRLR